MKSSNLRRSREIRFLPVDARPCDQIPGGTILGKAESPLLEEPIGWIVRSPAEIPSGEPPAKPSVVWHFLPTCGVDPAFSDFKDQGALQTAVRREYCGIYDRRPCKHRRQIAKGDDCEIESMVLEWCGLVDVWNDNELCDDYSVITDVLPDCLSIVYWSREWEGGGPGLSGYKYYVETEDPNLSVREIRKITEALLAEKRTKPPAPPPPPKRRRSSKAKNKPSELNLPAPKDH
jgi:hypothetical protein